MMTFKELFDEIDRRFADGLAKLWGASVPIAPKPAHEMTFADHSFAHARDAIRKVASELTNWDQGWRTFLDLEHAAHAKTRDELTKVKVVNRTLSDASIDLTKQVISLEAELSEAGLKKREELDEELQQIGDAVAEAGGKRDGGAVEFIRNLNDQLTTARQELANGVAVLNARQDHARKEVQGLRWTCHISERAIGNLRRELCSALPVIDGANQVNGDRIRELLAATEDSPGPAHTCILTGTTSDGSVPEPCEACARDGGVALARPAVETTWCGSHPPPAETTIPSPCMGCDGSGRRKRANGTWEDCADCEVMQRLYRAHRRTTPLKT